MPGTPQFVRWTLAHSCALREETDVTSAEQTERQLRSLRAYSDCRHEDRVFEDVCLAADNPALGFPSHEVLTAYGGETFVRSQCDSCAANTLRGRTTSGLAGCFGTLVLDAPRGASIDRAIASAALEERVAAHFLPTQPRWYGLWTTTPLTVAQLAVLRNLWEAMTETPQATDNEFLAALNIAQQHGFELHVRLYPAGESDRDWWRLAAHCGRCKAPQNPLERRCAVCGLVAPAEPARKRKPRGNRPFVPLARFLGEQAAAELLERRAQATRNLAGSHSPAR